jgi:acyl-CoA synthetase (AMP-forming)/AMP-acid ligase II
VVLAAGWRAGVVVVVATPGAGGAEVAAALDGTVAAFVREEWVTDAAQAAGGTTLVALTADLAGRSDHDLGAALRFARVVPTMGDLFTGDADPEGEALRLLPAGEAASTAALLGEAARLVEATGLGDGDRLLSGLGLLSPVGAAAGLLAPFGAGAGVVLARPFEPARFWRLVAAERVTVAALTLDQAEALLAAGRPPDDLDRSRLRVVACPTVPVPEALRGGLRERLDVRLAET